MDKLRKKGIAAAVWLVVLWALVTVYVFMETTGSQYTQEDDYLEREDAVYVTDNSLGFGMLYKLDKADGRVEKILPGRGQKYVNRWRYEKLAESLEESQSEKKDTNVYALLANDNAYQGQTTYRVVGYSEGLVEQMVTPSYLLDPGVIVTGFSLEQGRFCVTAVSEDRRRIVFYRISLEDLAVLKELDEAGRNRLRGEPVKIDPESDDTSGGGRYMEAELYNGTLHTRMEGEVPAGQFAENTEVEGLFDRRQMSFVQHYIASGVPVEVIVVVFLIGCALIWAVVELRSLQFRFVNRLIFYEGILVVAMAALFLIFVFAMQTSYENVFTHFAHFAIESLDGDVVDFGERPAVYESDEYAKLLSNMEAVARDDEGIVPCADICIVENASNEVLASIRGYTGHTMSYSYGQDSTGVIQASDGVAETEQYILVAHPVTGRTNYTTIFISQYPSVMTCMFRYGAGIPGLLSVTFILLSMVGSVVIYGESRDLRLVSGALRELAEGKTTYQKPENFMGWELERLWNNINEICRNILSINRIQFLTYKAYYRFAPKSIERILKKESITDVKCGDEIRLNGTIALVSAGKAGNLKANKDSANAFLEMVDRHRGIQDGIFISSTPDLSAVRLLFLEESGGSVRFGVDLLKEAQSLRAQKPMPRISLLVHYSTIVYGIAGTDNQATAYVSMAREKLFENFAEWFGRMGLAMVVTDSVKTHEKNLGDLRYIGFILLDREDPSQRVQIYEVLDAEPTSAHNGKRKTAKMFDDALQLFYQRDFYLARGAFTEIVRQMPEDGVAKWYLFECERLLNDAGESGFHGNLHYL